MSVAGFPLEMRIGFVFQIFGGLLSMFCIAYFSSFDSFDSLLAHTLVYLILATMFFGYAGGFSKTSQWRPQNLIFYGLLLFGVIFIVLLIGAVPPYLFLMFLTLNSISIYMSARPSTVRYLESYAQLH